MTCIVSVATAAAGEGNVIAYVPLLLSPGTVFLSEHATASAATTTVASTLVPMRRLFIIEAFASGTKASGTLSHGPAARLNF